MWFSPFENNLIINLTNKLNFVKKKILLKINFFLLSFFQINNKNCLINTHKENDFLQNREKIIIKFSKIIMILLYNQLQTP